jgi:hypothetical protein
MSVLPIEMFERTHVLINYSQSVRGALAGDRSNRKWESGDGRQE